MNHYSKRFFIIFLALFLVASAVPYAMAEDSATAPQGLIPDETGTVISNSPADVLLIQNGNPWWVPSNQLLLIAYGISYDQIDWLGIPGADFSQYKKIIIAGDQTTLFYNGAYMPYKTKFDDYVYNGGRLEWHACGYGWRIGDISGVVLPGGVGVSGVNPNNYNYVVRPTHGLVTWVPNPFWGNYASHDYLTNTGGADDLIVITTEGSSPGGNPTLIEYNYGSGCVVASGQPLEYGYAAGEDTGVILSNMIPYYCANINLTPTYLYAEIINTFSTKIRTIEVCYSVENQGNVYQNPSLLDFFLSLDPVLDMSDIFIGAVNIPGLDPGEETPVVCESFRVVVSALQSWYLIALTDTWDELAVPLLK